LGASLAKFSVLTLLQLVVW